MNNLILFLSLKFSKITKSFSSYISLIMIFRTMMNIIVNSKYHVLLPYVVRKAFRTSLTVRCLIVFCGSLYQIKETKFSWWFSYEGASLVAQRLKNLPAMQETQVWSLGQKDNPGEGNRNPVFLPGEFHAQRSPAGYSPWGHKESDMTEWLHFSYEEYWILSNNF